MESKVTVFWFRRDLLLDDNVGLARALDSDFPVLPIFIFGPNILGNLENKHDRWVDYFHQVLQKINVDLKEKASRIRTFFDKPKNVFQALSEEYTIQAVFYNRDYDPKRSIATPVFL